MDAFDLLAGALAGIPDWALFFVPALLLLYTLATVLFGGRQVYPYVAFSLIVLAAVLGAGRGAAVDLIYVGLTASVGGMSRMVLSLTPPRAKNRRECTPRFEDIQTARAESAAGEVPAYIPVEKCGIDMAHAREYLQRLRRAPLSAGDRLEVDVLGRSLESMNKAALTGEELVRINESLAALFKIAAKYFR